MGGSGSREHESLAVSAKHRKHEVPGCFAKGGDICNVRPNVLVVLNERWRVVDDPMQWILQVRKGRETARASGWRNRSFCVSRTGLRCSIGELCGEVDAVVVAFIETLPERHTHGAVKPLARIALKPHGQRQQYIGTAKA